MATLIDPGCSADSQTCTREDSGGSREGNGGDGGEGGGGEGDCGEGGDDDGNRAGWFGSAGGLDRVVGAVWVWVTTSPRRKQIVAIIAVDAKSAQTELRSALGMSQM